MKTPPLASNRSPNWAFMQKFEVPDYDHPERNYLTRWRIVQTPLFGVYLHKMDGPDPRPTLHDHPWRFISFVLRGGYVERVPEPQRPIGLARQRDRRISRVNTKSATDLHYIVRIEREPTWTLMFVGRRVRVWGYMHDDGEWIQFDQHPYAAEFDRALAARKAAS